MAIETLVGGLAANSYATITQLDIYSQHNVDRYPGYNFTAIQKESALIRATTYVDSRGGDRASSKDRYYTGVRANPDQSLKFPRVNCTRNDGSVISSTTIPYSITQATLEAALYEVNNPGGLHEVIKFSEVLLKGDAEVKAEYNMIKDVSQARNCLTLVYDYLSDILRMPSDGNNMWFASFSGVSGEDGSEV